MILWHSSQLNLTRAFKKRSFFVNVKTLLILPKSSFGFEQKIHGVMLLFVIYNLNFILELLIKDIRDLD